MFGIGEKNTRLFVLTRNLLYRLKIKKITINFCNFFINTVYSSPIDGQNKDQLLCELCQEDDGEWSNNRLNEMSILIKFVSLPSQATKKVNRILAAKACGFKNFNINYKLL